MEDDIFCGSCADVYSILLLNVFVPSKRVVQGGRHLSLEQSRLSKDANIDSSVDDLPTCDGKDNFLSSAGRKMREQL
jgi:hypothetical protein